MPNSPSVTHQTCKRFLGFPTDLTASRHGTLYVIDVHRVVNVDRSGVFTHSTEPISDVLRIAATDTGVLAVCPTRVLAFTPELQFEWALSVSLTHCISAVAVNASTLFVAVAERVFFIDLTDKSIQDQNFDACVLSVSVDERGAWILTESGTVHYCTPAKCEHSHQLRMKNPTHIVYHRATKTLFGIGASGDFVCIDVNMRRKLLNLSTNETLTCVVNVGSSFLIGTESGLVYLLFTDGAFCSVGVHDSPVLAAATLDDHTVATLGAEGSVKFWSIVAAR